MGGNRELAFLRKIQNVEFEKCMIFGQSSLKIDNWETANYFKWSERGDCQFWKIQKRPIFKKIDFLKVNSYLKLIIRDEKLHC